ncbi:expressed protein [Phakopsora pachyrhizi]|uniref:Expressed protein n=1 Tax=Phakopsora pachyrhizi TaxID=170000 RepID=A0AAV0AJE2_PHAPC|nr:expressed protein [Phakopsora pachyrhizi]
MIDSIRDYSEQCCVRNELSRWLNESGGGFHPNLVFGPTESDLSSLHKTSMGTCLFAIEPISETEILATCTSELAITPQNSFKRLEELFKRYNDVKNPSVLSHEENFETFRKTLRSWKDNQLTAFYLMLSKLAVELLTSTSKKREDEGLTQILKSNLFTFHKPYIQTIPSSESLTTPLYWKEQELEKLRFTDLYQAASQRKESWCLEYEMMACQIQKSFPTLFELMKQSLSCNDYIWANTILSSRAFPSSLLEARKLSDQINHDAFLPGHKRSLGDSKAVSEPTQILLPGIDALNHKRGARVEWRSVHNCIESSRVELVNLETLIQQGNQVFNNYGPKSTAELILGYGFALGKEDWTAYKFGSDLTTNPDDFFHVKLVAPSRTEFSSTIIKSLFESFEVEDLSHYVKRSEPIPELLLAQLRLLVLNDPGEIKTVERTFSHSKKSHSKTLFRDKFMEAMPPRISWENELDCIDCLRSLLETKLSDLLKIDHESEEESNWDGVREPIKRMIQIYRSGNLFYNLKKHLFFLLSNYIKEFNSSFFSFNYVPFLINKNGN